MVSASRRRFPAVCMVGPDWPCLICSFALILVPSVIFLVYISQEQHPFVLAGGVVTLLSNVIALAVTAFSNPGVIEKQSPAVMNAQAAELGARLDDVTPCAECNVYRNAYGYHCADCNSCVSQLDHHCPWTGKCIGEYNLRAFYAFLWTLLVNIVYVAICSFVYLLGGKKDE